jgi:hypothetical protein
MKYSGSPSIKSSYATDHVTETEKLVEPIKQRDKRRAGVVNEGPYRRIGISG